MTLHEIERALLPELAEKRSCTCYHFGQDTLSFKTLGATEVWGLDFSPVALREAAALAQDLDMEARWVLANATEIQEELVGQFDLVFASYGVLGCTRTSSRGWTRPSPI